MPLVAIPVFLQLSAACPGPGVPDARMLATAKVESGFNPFSLHDNTSRRSYAPESVTEAVVLARSLLAQGHSIDAGVMQVNDSNWRRLGLTADNVFEPAANVCAGKAVLAEAYARERAVSCMYNTGRPDCTNSYPARIEAAMSAAPVEVAAVPVPLSIISQPLAQPPPRPPAWDVYAAVSRPTPAQTAPVQLTANR
jgi:type IV secretion system protein VirB1